MLVPCEEVVVCLCVVLASSGIDYDIKLWMPTNEHPEFDEAAAKEVSKIHWNSMFYFNSNLMTLLNNVGRTSIRYMNVTLRVP